MKLCFGMVLCGLLWGTAHSAESWWKVFGDIQSGTFAGGFVDGEKKPDEHLKQFLAATKFDEWETFEDDLVKLSYPKHELLKLEVNGGKDGISVEGGVCTTVDNSFQRAYLLKAGRHTYGLFLVAKADWLDDGICLCGPMVHHVYRMEDGCLVRFSLLPGGAVKKAQMLGDKLRLMAFEWTHLACQREVYEEMVERMTLKIKHPWTEAQFQTEISKRYGLAGRSGWLHPGLALADANKVMGSEAKEIDGIYRWTGLQNDYPCELKADFKDGVLVKFSAEGVERTGEDAVKGSLHWAEDRIKNLTAARRAARDKERGLEPDDSSSVKPAPPPPTPTQIAEVVDAVVALAESTPDDRWWQVVGLMKDLIENKVREPRFVTAILKHGNGTDDELLVLKECGHKEIPQWIGQKLTAMLRETPSSQGPATMFNDPVESRANDASALLDNLALLDQAAAANHARALFETKEPAWTLAVLNGLDSLDACPIAPQELLAEGLRRAMAAKSTEMVNAVFRLINSDLNDLPDPDAIEKLIADLPKDKADSEWEKDKANAIKTLKAISRK